MVETEEEVKEERVMVETEEEVDQVKEGKEEKG
jgi:hypothetical protein